MSDKKEESGNITRRKKLLIMIIAIFIFLFLLIVRIGFIQFVQGSSLKEQMYRQLATNQIISPKRGTIYDSTGKALAMSAQVDTISINPTSIKVEDSDKEVAKQKTTELKEKVAKGLSEIFELNYEEVLEKVTSDSSVKTIVKKVEKDKVDKLKKWMEENKIYTGINIDEDTKRYYPYHTFASNLIGFCGDDNDGRIGLEYTWDDVLTGTPGKIITSKDAVQEAIPDKNKKYIAAQDGSDIVLTIDFYIQNIVEKYLKQGVQENNATRGGTAIVMNPKTGDILALASYPDYDLNAPYTPNTEDLAKAWDSLTAQEQTNSLFEMWRDNCISNTYEPGSTFKIINAAIALEEQITTPNVDGEFNCIGYEMINGEKIYCWRYYRPHGPQSLKEALGNSCNPAFMQLGKRIGASTLYKYYDALNLLNKTGVSAYAEATPIFHPLEDVKATELATMSFGQRFNITPLQLVSAVSGLVNDGKMMKPRIVKEIINTDDGSVTTIEPEEVRDVVSKETSQQLKEMMQYVVLDGTGQLVKIDGYSIGGKSGTSEPLDSKSEEGYIASFLAITPIENTELVVLAAFYGLHDKDNHQGGQVAGPVVRQILTEVLPYLGIASDEDTSEDNENSNYTTTILKDVRNKTVKEAIDILEEQGFTVSIGSNGDKNSMIVTDQVPKPGNNLIKGAVVKLYTDENDTRISSTVPNLKGMSIAQAVNALKSKNLNVSIEGNGKVISQDPIADTKVEEGTMIHVTLKPELTDAH